MVFITLLCVLLAGVFTILRFPALFANVSSKLHLPRLNFSRFFRNQKLKTILNDRYLLNQHSEQILEKKLFIVLGKNVHQIYNELLSKNGTNFINDIIWDEADESPFKIFELNEANYFFVHPHLLEKKIKEIKNPRIQALIQHLCAIRGKNIIEGVVYCLPEIPVQNSKNKSLFLELQEEIYYLNFVFKICRDKFHVQLPIFLIEHSFRCTFDSFQEIKLEDENFVGFSCDFTKKPFKKSEEFIGTQFTAFIEDFENYFKAHIIRSDTLKSGLSFVQLMHYIKRTNGLIIQHFVRYLLKNFDTKKENLPSSLTILNSCLFLQQTPEENLIFTFGYLDAHGIEKANVPKDFLKKINQNNIVLGLIAATSFFLFFISIWKSALFLSEQREKFEIAIQNFKILDESINSSFNMNNDNSFMLLEESTCRVIKNYASLQNISFSSILLFPSWKSDLNHHLQKKYKDKFSIVFSNFLLKKYSMMVDQMFAQENLGNLSIEESLNGLKNYVLFFSNYGKIYTQLTSNKAENINKALISISKIIYSNKCVENEQAYDFLSKIDSKSLNLLIPPQILQSRISEKLIEKSAQYFQSFITNNLLMSAALNLNEDISNFARLVDEFEHQMETEDDNDLSSVVAAFKKLSQDYQVLSNEFIHGQTKSLENVNDFFGSEFSKLMETLNQDSLFDNKSILTVRGNAESAFMLFKKRFDTSGIIKENGFSVLLIDDKLKLSIHPKVKNLFTILDKLTNFISSQVNPKNFTYSDHMSWNEKKLHNIIQKYSDIQNEFEQLEFDSYPEEFSDYLENYLFNCFEKFWSYGLFSGLTTSEKSNANLFYNEDVDNQDPHGIVSSANALKQIVEIFVAEHFENVLADFDAIYLKQMEGILKQKTIQFDKKDLFGENANFRSWNGAISPAAHIFYANSDDSLMAMLEKQRQILFDFYTQNIEHSLKAMIPIVQLRPNLRSALYNRWYSIGIALDSKSKSFQSFSNFVLGDLKKFQPNDCARILEFSRDSNLVSDYFEARIEYLYEKLNERCRVMYMNTAINDYSEIAHAFNELLAGKYPFIKSHQNGIETQGMADPNDLDKMLEKFDTFRKTSLPFLQKYHGEFADDTAVVNFVDQMSKIQDFFGRKDQLEGFFQFRSRKDEENLAHHIVNWELKIGGANYGSLYGNLLAAKFPLSLGVPLSLTLEFASDIKPKEESLLNRNMSKIVNKDSIAYVFKSKWSLFQLVDSYNTCDSKHLCQKEKLKFNIPLKNEESVVIFCEFSIFDEKGKKISMPVFPSSAPNLHMIKRSHD